MRSFINSIKIKSIKLWILILIHSIRRKWKLLAGILICLAALVFIQQRLGFISFENVLSEGFVGTYQSHDLPIEVTRLLSQGLVKPDEEGRMKPNLVSGWESNKEATEFTFKLKEGLKWVDGELIKSFDLEFPIPNVEVSYPDDQTIAFKLKEPFSPFPSLLTKPIFKKGTLLGIGPYRIKRIEKSKVFIAKMYLDSNDPKFPDIIIRFYPSEDTAKTGFALGETEALLGINNYQNLLSNPLVKIYQKTDYGKIVTLLYNTKHPKLGNRSLRQALGFIIPKIEDNQEANSPFSIYSWAYDQTSKKYLDNPQEAKEALSRAKSAIGKEILGEELILTTTPQLEEVGNKIITAWKELGFDAKLRTESGIAQNFQALLITQTITVDPDQYILWHSTQEKTNLTKYSSLRVDKDLEDGRKILDEEERKSKYEDFQKALLEDAPATFLYYPKYNLVYLKKAETDLFRILDLQMDPLKK